MDHSVAEPSLSLTVDNPAAKEICSESKPSVQERDEENAVVPDGTCRPYQSSIPSIWQAFFQQMERIDQLEKRVEEYVSRKRRRIQNIVEQLPSHRRSTVRMFVTHQFDKYSGMWTLVVEGKLLIGNLDHISAEKVEKEGGMHLYIV